METPDVTKAQVGAIAVAAIGVLGTVLPLPDETVEALKQFALVTTPTLVAGDAIIRHGRSKIAAAKVQQGVLEPTGDTPVIPLTEATSLDAADVEPDTGDGWVPPELGGAEEPASTDG